MQWLQSNVYLLLFLIPAILLQAESLSVREVVAISTAIVGALCVVIVKLFGMLIKALESASQSQQQLSNSVEAMGRLLSALPETLDKNQNASEKLVIALTASTENLQAAAEACWSARSPESGASSLPDRTPIR